MHPGSRKYSSSLDAHRASSQLQSSKRRRLICKEALQAQAPSKFWDQPLIGPSLRSVSGVQSLRGAARVGNRGYFSASEPLTPEVGALDVQFRPRFPSFPSTLSVPLRAVDPRVLRRRGRGAESSRLQGAKNRSRPPASWAGPADRWGGG